MDKQQTFQDLPGFLDFIEATRDAKTGTFQALHPGNPPESFGNPNTAKMGALLPDMLSNCRTLHGFDAAIARIEALADGLAAQAPALPTIRRQRVKGASGYAINPHKVLRGDLAHAWTRMSRVSQPHGGRLARLMLCPVFSWSCSATQIEWTSASTLALAAVLEASGRSVDIWSVLPLHGNYADAANNLQVNVCLKASGEPWNTQNLALAADPGWLRRLHFRMAETQPGLNSGYSKVNFQVWRECCAALSLAQGWDPASMLHGGLETHGITTEAGARTWLKATLAHLQGHTE